MMPMCKDSPQPCQMRPQGYFHHHQGFGNNIHHTNVDAPSPCYGSCVHGNFPAYNAYWPPCYHPHVPCHQCYVNHSGFHPHHASYTPPCYVHPPFPVGYQQPWYDSEKGVPGKHHCGTCSPQIWDSKNNRGVVIEEQEPETDKQNQREVVLPVSSTSYPYPIMWIPHEKARNQEHGIFRLSGDYEQPSAKVKAPENMTVQKSIPKSWNGCFPMDESTMKSLQQNQDKKNAQNGETVELPFDISKLKSSLKGQDMKEAQIQMNKEEPGQLPYPIFWIPSHGKREDVEASESKKNCSEAHNLKSLASNLHENESQKPQIEGKEGNTDCYAISDAKEKTSIRNIPVQNHLQEPSDVPVKLSEKQLPKATEPTKKIVKNEPVGDTKKQHSSASPKSSRLPPVCLRVDPLPKKINHNHGSKSLSPPRQKDDSLTLEESKVAPPLHSKKAESKTVPEVCNLKCEEANKEVKMPEGRLNAVGTENKSVDKCSNLQEGSNSKTVRPCETEEKSGKPAKKTFTEEEAAKIIQSRYRGYDVRRWETLKKLKEIATVREQMGDVQKRIKALEVSTDQHIEEKEIVIVGEMVMNLLLKLDSVQGLHPSIRDYRKSMARKLSDIEEKLDSLKKSSAISAITKEEAVKEHADITSQRRQNPVNVEPSGLAEEKRMVSESNTEKALPLSPEDHPMNFVDRMDEQPVAEAEEGTRSDENLSDLKLATDGAICEPVFTSTTAQGIGEVETPQPNNPPSADENGVAMTNCVEDKAVLESLEKPQHELPQVEQTTRGPGLNSTEVFEAEANTSENEDGKGDDDPLLASGKAQHELPQGEQTTRGPGLNATEVFEAEANTSENEDGKGDDDPLLASGKDVELSELPVGVIDDETQPLPQCSLSCTCESEVATMDPETMSQEKTDVDISCDNSKGQDTSESQEQLSDTGVIVKKQPLETLGTAIVKEQPLETEVIVKGQPVETKVIVNEQPAETKVIVNEQPAETKVIVNEQPAETKVIVNEPLNTEAIVSELPDTEAIVNEQPLETEAIVKEQPLEIEDIVKEQPPETEVTENEISEETKMLMEENQRFKETMETLVKAGREQLEVISKLTGRVKNLEKKLSQKRNRTRVGHRRPSRTTKPMAANLTEPVM